MFSHLLPKIFSVDLLSSDIVYRAYHVQLTAVTYSELTL